MSDQKQEAMREEFEAYLASTGFEYGPLAKASFQPIWNACWPIAQAAYRDQQQAAGEVPAMTAEAVEKAARRITDHAAARNRSDINAKLAARIVRDILLPAPTGQAAGCALADQLIERAQGQG